MITKPKGKQTWGCRQYGRQCYTANKCEESRLVPLSLKISNHSNPFPSCGERAGTDILRAHAHDKGKLGSLVVSHRKFDCSFWALRQEAMTRVCMTLAMFPPPASSSSVFCFTALRCDVSILTNSRVVSRFLDLGFTTHNLCVLPKRGHPSLSPYSDDSRYHYLGFPLAFSYISL
jgi:hypothetical protein